MSQNSQSGMQELPDRLAVSFLLTSSESSDHSFLAYKTLLISFQTLLSFFSPQPLVEASLRPACVVPPDGEFELAFRGPAVNSDFSLASHS